LQAEQEEAEAARLLAEQEAAEELERARLQAEQEEAEAARLLAEQAEAARLQAEQEAAEELERARLQAEQEEAEAARLLAEQAEAEELERARLKDVQEVGASELKNEGQRDYLVGYVPVFVMKSLFAPVGDDSEKKKLFINVCSHDQIPKSKIIIGLQCPLITQDKNGDDTLVYDICVSSEQFASDEAMEVICSKILNYLNAMLSQEGKGRIDMVYKLPKIKNQFKGSHTASFVRIEL
jgi:hypothetical protein